MRVPFGDARTSSHHIALVHRHDGAVGDLVALALATELVLHAQLTAARHRHLVPLLVAYALEVVEPDGALVLDFHVAGSSRTRSGTTDVEGTHRQLRARLTDGLGGDDADRFTDVDPAATS